MPRIARVVVPGMAHHITQRGVRRLNVFHDEEDRRSYIELFISSAHKYALHVDGYSLMTNHVHFVAVPECLDSIHRVFHRCNSGYSKFYNEKYRKSGYLFEQRPWSCVVSEERFKSVLRYVELNPVRARMVPNATDYPWSSARAHCLGSADPILPAHEDHLIPGWQEWLCETGSDPTIDEAIRKCTSSGRPCGDDAFIRDLEARTGRSLRLGKRGRPPKEAIPPNAYFEWEA